MTVPLHVDIWSDVACPWCYLGKRRFELAVERFAADHPDVTVEVVFRSFELSPDTPEDVSGTIVDYLEGTKGWPREQIRAAHEHVTALAAEVGLAFDFASQRPANTRKTLELLHLARQRGRQTELKERLQSAHFVEGRHVGQDDELVELAAEAGLDRVEVERALAERIFAPEVEADLAEARQLGITGVPFFVLDGRFAVSGAQPIEVFARALERTLQERVAARD